MAAVSAANANESRSTRNSIAMPPSCDVDQAPYDSSWVPVGRHSIHDERHHQRGARDYHRASGEAPRPAFGQRVAEQ